MRDALHKEPVMEVHQCNCYYFGEITRIVAENTIRDFVMKRFLEKVTLNTKLEYLTFCKNLNQYDKAERLAITEYKTHYQ